jgi:hypothetical protein
MLQSRFTRLPVSFFLRLFPLFCDQAIPPWAELNFARFLTRKSPMQIINENFRVRRLREAR